MEGMKVGKRYKGAGQPPTIPQETPPEASQDLAGGFQDLQSWGGSVAEPSTPVNGSHTHNGEIAGSGADDPPRMQKISDFERAISDRIERKRDALHISGGDLMRACGLHRTYYDKYKNYQVAWTLDRIGMITDLLKTSKAELVFGDTLMLDDRDMALMAEAIAAVLDACAKARRSFSDYDADIMARFMVRECVTALRIRSVDAQGIADTLELTRR
jgi:hypothetical protein